MNPAADQLAAVAAVDLSWQAEAACRDLPPSRVDAMTSATTSAHLELLDWVCADCPVAWSCLTFGIETRASGIWGAHVLTEGRDATQPRPAKTKRKSGEAA